MRMTVKTVAVGKVLNVFSSGDFSLEEAMPNFLEILVAVEENKSEKVLIDGREVRGDPSIIERFYYGQFAADTVSEGKTLSRAHSDPQFAYVLHEPVLDPLRLGETVATNRGMNVKAFDNYAEAVQWLGLKPEEIVDFTRRKVEVDQT